nr:immunoglobulin light chain junction region [Macaca mulatta]
CYQQSSGWTF